MKSRAPIPYLYLQAPSCELRVLSEFEQLPRDVSYGRKLDGGNAVVKQSDLQVIVFYQTAKLASTDVGLTQEKIAFSLGSRYSQTRNQLVRPPPLTRRHS
jgi:hypothetical protein